MDQRFQPTTPEVDPMVVAAVRNVRDRFGAEGLRDLMALAKEELGNVEEAERRLAAAGSPDVAPAESFDAADTQAWRAYTEAEPERGGQERR